LFDGSRSFGGLADWREALFFDCLVRKLRLTGVAGCC